MTILSFQILLVHGGRNIFVMSVNLARMGKHVGHAPESRQYFETHIDHVCESRHYWAGVAYWSRAVYEEGFFLEWSVESGKRRALQKEFYRVFRGGYIDGLMDGMFGGWMDKLMDGRVDARMDGWMNEWMDVMMSVATSLI